MTTKTADPITVLRDRTGRSVDVSPILDEMLLLQHREHWRDDQVRIMIEAWRRRIAQDTGSTNAPIEFAERLAGHIDPRFQKHLLLTWNRVTGKAKKAKNPKSLAEARSTFGPWDTRIWLAKPYHMDATDRAGGPLWHDDLAGFSFQQRWKLGYLAPPALTPELMTDKPTKTPPEK